MHIPIILGTGRKDRQSEKAANFILQETKKLNGIKTELVDVRDFPMQNTNDSETSDQSKGFAELAARADGFIVVVPEYNHGYPGELKMALDMVYTEYNKKPVGICGVSAGGMGGVRAVEQLRLVAIELQMVPIHSAIYFSKIDQLFDENGHITDTSYTDQLKGFFDELLWYAKALKQARQQ